MTIENKDFAMGATNIIRLKKNMLKLERNISAVYKPTDLLSTVK